MKNFTANSFLKVCSGIAMVIIATAILFFSVKKAEATSKINFSDLKTSLPVGTGKYQFAYNSGVDNNNSFYWQMVIFNTETGAYKAFYWDRDEQKWDDMFNKSAPLPMLP